MKINLNHKINYKMIIYNKIIQNKIINNKLMYKIIRILISKIIKKYKLIIYNN